MNSVGFQCDGCFKYEIIDSTSGYCHLNPRFPKIPETGNVEYMHPTVPNDGWCAFWSTDKRVP